MKLLLDECVDQRFRNHIAEQDVFTVGYLGWAGTKNGALLRRAATEGFDCLITTDHGISKQHNPTTLPIAVICLAIGSDDLEELVGRMPALQKLLSTLVPKTFNRIE